MADILITSAVSIPEDEVQLRFSRSGGPGGQHVNTSSTKVELRFDIDASASLTPFQKARIRRILGARITTEGVLVLQSSEHRSQTRNREAVIARFAALLGDALRPRKRRTPTTPTRAAKRRRLEDKRQRSDTKALRRPPEPGA